VTTTTRPRNGRQRSSEVFRPYSLVLGERHRRTLENLADTNGVTLSEACRVLIERYEEQDEEHA